jgi:hypothetical protein
MPRLMDVASEGRLLGYFERLDAFTVAVAMMP